MRSLLSLTSLLLSAVLLAACSGGSGTASPTAATARTIQVTMLDTMRFEPADIAVKVGETVNFEVRNAGVIVHEFYVGTAEEQIAHEEEMLAGHEMHDHQNSVTVDPGDTRTLQLTFARAGVLEIGCHVPGHWPAGMRGTITVT